MLETKPAAGTHPLVEKYIARIPEGLRDLLSPGSEQYREFADALKALRLKEEERYYVMGIQRRYRLPIRPNESVKRTMIRVRLAIWKKRRQPEADIDPESAILDLLGPLPVDPLE
ncbi:MAG: hypothetical protein AB1772_09985 [Candidatus Zixiibacteriota bacterium]